MTDTPLPEGRAAEDVVMPMFASRESGHRERDLGPAECGDCDQPQQAAVPEAGERP